MIVFQNLLTLIATVVFIVFMVKVWQLVRHKSISLFILAGIVGLGLRAILLLENSGIFSAKQTLSLRTLLGNTVWILWALAAIFLYFEINKLIRRHKG